MRVWLGKLHRRWLCTATGRRPLLGSDELTALRGLMAGVTCTELDVSHREAFTLLGELPEADLREWQADWEGDLQQRLRWGTRDVAVIDMEKYPFGRVLGAKVGATYKQMLDDKKIEWYGGRKSKQIRGTGSNAHSVELDDGTLLPADCVIIAAGRFFLYFENVL